MRIALRRILDGVTTDKGMVIVTLLAVTIGALGHGYWVCTTLAEERAEHRTYMNTTSEARHREMILALNASTAATNAQTQFNRELRHDLDRREGVIISATNKIEALLVSAEWQFREFRKAALAFVRAQEHQDE